MLNVAAGKTPLGGQTFLDNRHEEKKAKKAAKKAAEASGAGSSSSAGGGVAGWMASSWGTVDVKEARAAGKHDARRQTLNIAAGAVPANDACRRHLKKKQKEKEDNES